MTRIPGGTAVVRCLEGEQVEMVFGQPGSHNLAIYDALRMSASIRHISVVHEGNAAVMADVYGRLTGRPGVCLTTAGPGATNAITGICQAYAARSPVIHISGHCETTGVLPFHGLYYDGFLKDVFRPITKESIAIRDGSTIGRLFGHAFSTARRGKKGPVHIEIPKDILEGDVGFDGYDAPAPAEPPVSPALVAEAARYLREARAPIILASQGVTRDAATEELRMVAEALSAPVMTPWVGRSTIPFAHPLSFGFALSGGPGIFMPPAFRETIDGSDLLLIVGCEPGEALYDVVKKHPRVVYLDNHEDGAAMEKVDPLVAITANIKQTLGMLLSELKSFTPNERALERAGRILKEKHRVREAVLEFVEGIDQPQHIGAVIAALNRAIPGHAIVTSDVGLIDSWMFALFPSQWPHNVLTPGRFGSMGFALPAAIASKLCFPDRPAVAICGDGSFLMSHADFGTAVGLGLPIIMVVLNDRHFGTIRKMQQMEYGARYVATEIHTPDFARYAEAYGAKTFSVERFSEIEAVFEKALRVESPVLVVVNVDGQVPFFRCPPAS